jgi:CPA2 family monovalent cation:H+ antiporter-2
MEAGLTGVLVLLANAVLAVVACRLVGLPPLVGYLALGVVTGPHALAWVPDTEATRALGEFGVVFLMFTIGLEFNLGRLFRMRRLVFGLGGLQVGLTIALVAAVAIGAAAGWREGFALGAIIALSSTAIVLRLLADRREVDAPHGREVFGVLLFQDLAVVPLLIVIPALAEPPEVLLEALGLAALKACVVLGVLLFAGQRLMRAWFHVVARRRSAELFSINVLFIVLSLAWVTEQAGLSLALGAFVGGMLIAETEYRHQVEEDIKPFREVLLGLFFITMGMRLDLNEVLAHPGLVAVLLVGQLALKMSLVAALSRALGSPAPTALRTALALAPAGEFGLVLAALAGAHQVVPAPLLQAAIASMLLTMFAGPLLIQWSDAIVLRFTRSAWLEQSLALTGVAVRSIQADRHVIVCGFGRTGQSLVRFLEHESLPYVALDLDPDRVREASAAGQSVVFGDASRRETLLAAGLARASAVVVCFNDTPFSLRLLAHVRQLMPALPVVVRTRDDGDLDRLEAAGATEVVPDTFEASLMLASHALMLIGVPPRRVLGRIRDTRHERYALLRGFFHGASDFHEGADEDASRLHAVTLEPGAWAVGRSLAEAAMPACGVVVAALRDRDRRVSEPGPETVLAEGMVLVLRGSAEAVSLAEMRLIGGTTPA